MDDNYYNPCLFCLNDEAIPGEYKYCRLLEKMLKKSRCLEIMSFSSLNEKKEDEIVHFLESSLDDTFFDVIDDEDTVN
ncbi:MAG: hypothetical protein M1371_11135 [Actinobacteria bacterium]|nr:hypothetical protein [Actinomycetota bacterium]